MAMWSAGITIGQGFANKTKLESKIKSLKLLDESSVLDFYKGEQRLIYALDICDALILDRAANDIQNYTKFLNIIEREYLMSQEGLSHENASKAQVYALGLAIKEIALINDADKKQIDEDQEKTDKEIKLLREQLAKTTSKINIILIIALIALFCSLLSLLSKI